MKKGLIYITLLLIQITVFSQENNFWLFAPNIQVKLTDTSYNITNVSNKFPAYIEGHAVIQDTTGDLLFYTDGGKVYDRNHDLMSESISIPIEPESNTKQQCNIVKSSLNKDLYFMFSLNHFLSPNGELFFSSIDMRMRNGYGDVVKNSIKKVGDGYAEAMVVMPHKCNGYWVIVNKRNSMVFDAFHFIGDRMIKKVSSTVGSFYNLNTKFAGALIKVNNDELIYNDYNGLLERIKFNMISGELELLNVIYNPTLSSTKVLGIGISPNEEFLYTYEFRLGVNTINQYELKLKNTADIISSKIELHKGTLFSNSDFTTTNSKIYFISITRPGALSMIQNPDTKGIGAQFVLDRIILPNSANNVSSFPTPLIIEPNNNVSFLPQDTTSCKEISLMSNSTFDSIQWSTGSKAPMITLSQSGQYSAIGYKDGCPYLDTFRLTIQQVTQSKTIETCGTFGISYKGKIYNIGDQFIDTIAGAACDTLLQYSVIKSPTGIEKKETIYLCGGGAHRSSDGTIYRDGDTYTTTKKSNVSGQCDTVIHYTVTALYRNNFLGNDTTSCKYDPLIKSVSLFQDEKILWEDGTTNSYMKFDKKGFTIYNYKAELTTNGCTFKDTVRLTINSKAEIVKKYICVGEKVLNEGKEYGVGEPYQIIRKTALCDTVSIYALINPPPIKIMTKDTYTASIGLSLEVSYSATPASYHWQPSENLSCSDCPIPKLLRPISGIYTIAAKDQYGCIYSDSVVVEAINDIVLPTIIRPNSSTVENSHFFVKGQDQWTYDMLIYDRWGNKVFDGRNLAVNDAAAGWSPAESLSSGVYQYRITIHTDNGDIFKLSDVTIVR